MRCASIEVLKIESADGTAELLREVYDEMQCLCNRFYRTWELAHVAAGNDDLVRQWREALLAWHRSDPRKRGAKPKCPVAPLSAALSKSIYAELASRFPGIHSRTRVLVQQKLRGQLVNKKSSRSAFKVWQEVLADRERASSFRTSQPIPFDKQNASLLRDEEDNVWLRLKIARRDRAGKQRGVGVELRCLLKTKGRSARYARPVVEMALGERPLAGSNLIWSPARRKWFALLSYAPAPRAPLALDPQKVLFLKPGRKRPWFRRVGGQSRAFGGRGRDVAAKRSSLLRQRFGRAEAYRFSTGRKGHGIGRGITPQYKLSRAWQHFCQTRNAQWASDACWLAAELGCGRIVILSPTHWSVPRYLERAGKLGRNDATGWPWHQFEKKLADKAQELGISVQVFKPRRRRKCESA